MLREVSVAEQWRLTAGYCALNMAFLSLHIHSNHIVIRNTVRGSRSPGAAVDANVFSNQSTIILNPRIAHAVPFVAGEKCTHHHSHRRACTRVTTCQASDSEHLVDRRQLLGAGISLAAAVQLRTASPAAALVVSKEWEKVPHICLYQGT